MNYNELLEQYGGIGLERQSNLGDIVGENNWNVDLNKGLLSFGENINFPIQILGTYAFDSETWLWAWANADSKLDENLLVDGKKLYNYGRENEIEFLTTAEFEADQTNLHAIGIIASGLLDSSAYYCGNYGQGIILMTIKSEQIDNVEFNEQARILSTLPDLINIFTLNHKNAFESYLAMKGYTIAKDGDSVKATKAKQAIYASFDEADRLTSLKGEITE